jgi:hypothetical protein
MINRPCTPSHVLFWRNVVVNQPNDCWGWNGSVSSTGYAKFTFRNGPKQKSITVSAHRFSWEIHNGPISPGLCICHTCDNRTCANPNHLFLGSYSDNIKDAIKKGRMLVGEKNHNSKLTESEVKEVIIRRRSGETIASIASSFGVVTGTIKHIIHGRNWRHIECQL